MIGSSATRPTPLFIGVGLVLLYLVIPPLVILIQTSFWVATSLVEGHVGFDNYAAVLRSEGLPLLVSNSLTFGLGSSAVALVLGGTLAWLVERTNTPLKNVAYVSAFVALAIPGIIKAVGWVLLLGPQAGLINVLLVDLLGLRSMPFNIYTMEGMIFVEGLLWTPAVFLLAVVPLHSMDPSLEEAATTSGANTWQMLRRVTLPLATPALISILLLTFVRAVETFEIPAIVGIPGRVFVLSTRIYQEIRLSLTPDYGIATAYAVLLMALVAVGIYFYGQATRQAERFATITGKGYRPRLLELGRARYAGAVAVLVLPLLTILPFLVLVWASVLPFYTRPSLEGPWNFTLRNYAGAFANTNVRNSLTNSLVIGIVTATAAVSLAAVAAWLVARTRITGRSALDFLVSSTLVFPGVVLGVAMLRTYLTIPVPIYGTIWIIVVAYVTRFVAYAMRYAHPGIIQIHRELEDAAQASGAHWFTAFRRIVVPLMMPALFSAWVWIFLVSLRELSVAVLLAGPQSQVVASAIFELWENGQFTQMAAYSVVIAVFTALFALAIRRVSQRWGLHL